MNSQSAISPLRSKIESSAATTGSHCGFSPRISVASAPWAVARSALTKSRAVSPSAAAALFFAGSEMRRAVEEREAQHLAATTTRLRALARAELRGLVGVRGRVLAGRGERQRRGAYPAADSSASSAAALAFFVVRAVRGGVRVRSGGGGFRAAGGAGGGCDGARPGGGAEGDDATRRILDRRRPAGSAATLRDDAGLRVSSSAARAACVRRHGQVDDLSELRSARRSRRGSRCGCPSPTRSSDAPAGSPDATPPRARPRSSDRPSRRRASRPVPSRDARRSE